MYITICKTDYQYKFNAWCRAPKSGALGQPRGMGGREMGVQDWGDTWICGRLILMYGKNHHSIVK